MKTRAFSIAVCLSVGAALALGAACTSVPDRKVLPAGFHGGPDASAGGSGDSGIGGVTGNGGAGNDAAVGGASGAGGAGKGGGAGSDGGTVEGGTLDGGGLTCGGSPCKDYKGFGVALLACCAGTQKNTCGLDTSSIGGPGCLELNQPGGPDTTCPTQTSAGATHAGCCLDRSSTCGVAYAVPGGPDFGCVDLTVFGPGIPVQSCTPVCTSLKGPCTVDSDCCDQSPKTAACIPFSTTGSVCSTYCSSNAECTSGCCVILNSGRGACAPDATQCSGSCAPVDATCTTDADCCTGNACVSTGSPGPNVCRPVCTSSQECGGEYCLKDAVSGKLACSRKYSGLCSDTCQFAKDGTCDDGGPGSAYSVCALGSDCSDCASAAGAGVAARLGGVGFCSDTCTGKSSNGRCEDGGTSSVDNSCGFGTDCADCGPRLGICSDSCRYANDHSCDDGGPNAIYADCAPGTDCSDCGVRHGGRGQAACDGTTGKYCQPGGSGFYGSGGGDGTCTCPDCAWDQIDCRQPTACNGASISTCCAAGNPCGLDADGVCNCGGWCEWEKADCVSTGPGSRCDGFSISSYCDYKYPGTPDQLCDCHGACSWEAPDCAQDFPGVLCDDTCLYAGDGSCDDDFYCSLGTDCADCGPRLPP